jgi:hypothetical protein
MIYVTGDMHGDESRLYDAQWRKLKPNDILIVCGDFGYLWDGGKREKSVIEYLGSRKFTVCFVDGTHENFTTINKCRETIWNGGHVHRISGNLFHLMRGQIFNIDGVKIFTFGGGESDDRLVRNTEGSGIWFREELPTPRQLAEGAKNLDDAGLKVDYIITHEPPLLVKSAMLLRKGQPDNVNKLNGYFGEVAKSVEFKHWYFGSLHEDRLVTANYTCLFEKIIPLGSKEQPK